MKKRHSDRVCFSLRIIAVILGVVERQNLETRPTIRAKYCSNVKFVDVLR